MKLSEPIVQKHIPSPQNYVQTNCPSVVLMLFKSIGITLQQFVGTYLDGTFLVLKACVRYFLSNFYFCTK